MPFQPGQSGNPAGRPPKEQALTTLLRDYLEEVDIETGLQRKKRLVAKLYESAIKGDSIAAKYIFDRLDGKVVESHSFIDDEGNPQKIEFIIKNYTNGDKADSQ